MAGKKSREFLFPHHESISHNILAAFWIQTFVTEYISTILSSLSSLHQERKKLTILPKEEVLAALVDGPSLSL